MGGKMGAVMTTTGLTYADLVEAAGLMADRLLAAQGQVLNLNQQLGAAHGEVAALRGVLKFERERTRELRKLLKRRRIRPGRAALR